jgi:hypothetical protein
LHEFYGGLSPPLRAELQSPAVLPLVADTLRAHFDRLVRELIPDVFQFIPTARTKELRSFAKQLDESARTALKDFDPAFSAMTLSILNSFGHVRVWDSRYA